MFSLNFNKKNVINFWSIGFIIFAWVPTVFASEGVNNWVGVVREISGFHTPKHEKDHNLEFVRKADGKSFDIVNSPEILKLHTAKDKNLLVQIDGEQTSRFLFWGGNLVVKNFNVIQELDEITHKEAPENIRRSRIDRN